MLDDSDQLEKELNWDTHKEFDGPNRRIWKWWRAPLGSHAILVFTMLYGLPIGLVTFKYVGDLHGFPGLMLGIGVVLLVLLVANHLARFTWRLIGPIGRTLIRPTMILGPIPAFVLACLALAMFKMVLTGELDFESRGKNWSIPPKATSTMFLEARALCPGLGPQWRLPREDEVEKLNPLPRVKTESGVTRYWLQPASRSDGAPDVMLFVDCRGPSCTHEVQRVPPLGGRAQNMAAVVCVDF